MNMLKIKIYKFVSLLFALALSMFTLVNLSSCTDDEKVTTNEPKPIYEISFMWNGEMQTAHSTVTLLFTLWQRDNSAEYANAPDKYKFYGDDSRELYNAMQESENLGLEIVPFITELSKKEHQPISIMGLEETDIKKNIYIIDVWGSKYMKSQFLGFVYNYVYVDIIDHQTLSITTWEGTTVYTVSSYKITYFDDLK